LRIRHLQAICLALVLGTPVLATAADHPSLPSVALPSLHTNAAQTVRLRTPADWTVNSTPGEPEMTEARGAGLLVRILRREGELGLDGLHVDCMLVRLAPETQTRPGIEYEYDFVTGAAGDRRAADSAFVVHYDAPIEGSRDWRQRNLTIVGGGESLCVIGYAPLSAWKRKETRRLLDAVLASVEFKPWR
jgi:hypothetical protein